VKADVLADKDPAFKRGNFCSNGNEQQQNGRRTAELDLNDMTPAANNSANVGDGTLYR
jgi:hypothetical protein